MWFYTLVSVSIVSLVSLVGVIALSLRENVLKRILIYLVSFSAGALLGDAFIHLLPEAVKESGLNLKISLSILSGLIVYFIVEKFIRWRHCHFGETEEHYHPFSLMILFGDGVHNFIDGLIIGASYLISIPLGLATTLAVISHEIPQEIGDFASLLHGGIEKKKAIFFNFLSGLTAIAGAVIILILEISIDGVEIVLISFAVGGFIYIAAADLIPELHKEVEIKKSVLQLFAFMFGIMVMLFLVF